MAKKKPHPKYLFVVGGVMSGVGKGIASSSIGAILQSRGFTVTAVKIDPYVNVDAGTMNPTEHGEVFVLGDGTECDQDMGNYERFLNKNLTGANYMTTGSIYLSVINRERNLDYKGHCVEVVPHIPLEVISRPDRAARENRADIVITEIGGTVGEYQNVLFLEAIRMLRFRQPDDVFVVLVSHLPTLSTGGGELKTKPTQYAVRTLNAAGLQPDLVIARASVTLDKKRKEKIAFNCNLNPSEVISAPDIESIYDVPINFEKDGLSDTVLEKLKLRPRRRDLREWRAFVEKTKRVKKPVRIGIVGKYFDTGKFILEDSYISVIEALKHASFAHGLKPQLEWMSAEDFDPGRHRDWREHLERLKGFNGIVVPGGFGSRAIEGKIAVIQCCRENSIPYFGLCYGMQLAVVEFARSIAGLTGAHTTEINAKTPHPVIAILPEQEKVMQSHRYGATMRLGSYPAILTKGSLARAAYGSHRISERHRHRYEVNPEYLERLEAAGAMFSGRSPDRRLMEIFELPRTQHPFFLGTQFHPELTSRPLAPHPLFAAFIAAAGKRVLPTS